MLQIFKILVYLFTVPFIAFWMWIGIKAILGKVSINITFLGRTVRYRWSIVAVSCLLVIKNVLLLTSATAVEAIAVMLIEFYDRIYLVWSDILVEISKWNQPWF
jgi:hypothetical protein